MTDPRAMRALAHPVRLELLDRLAVAGTLTAAQAAQLVGETPANCSFHFRVLAKYGFVESAPGGRGHVRPWRRVPGGIGIAEVHADTEASAGARSVTDLIVNRHLNQIRDYRSADQYRLPTQWRELGGHISLVTQLTVAELRELRAELIAVLARYAGRDGEACSRPADSRQVRLLAFAMPAPRPGEVGDVADENGATGTVDDAGALAGART